MVSPAGRTGRGEEIQSMVMCKANDGAIFRELVRLSVRVKRYGRPKFVRFLQLAIVY